MEMKRVLLIEDEAGLRRNLAVSLKQENFEIEPCENGVKGLERLETLLKNGVQIDYVLTDIRLPDIDGMKLLKVIKSKYPGIPVVVMSAYGNDSIQKEIEIEKGDGFIDKPFDNSDLTRIFNNLSKKSAHGRPEISKNLSTKSVSGYAMIKIKNTEDFYSIYQKIYFMDNILYCDATKGEFDLFVLMQAQDYESLVQIIQNKIMKIKGISQVDYMEVTSPVLDEKLSAVVSSVDEILEKDFVSEKGNIVRSSGSVATYVMLEIEKEKFESLYPSLHFCENVVHCDVTRGSYDFVLLIQTESFEEMDRIISEKIRPLDGIIRIKKAPIVKILEM